MRIREFALKVHVYLNSYSVKQRKVYSGENRCPIVDLQSKQRYIEFLKNVLKCKKNTHFVLYEQLKYNFPVEVVETNRFWIQA